MTSSAAKRSSDASVLIAFGTTLAEKEKEKATPVGDHNGSLCMETVAAWDHIGIDV